MSSPSILANGIGKKFLVRSKASRSDTLAETVFKGFKRGLIRLHRLCSGTPYAGPGGTEEFWALRDVSFELQRGEVLGIIGRNGSGKSTLLKVLSRITPPTEGEAVIEGRVGSLLEIGTGFHQELTGRENTYLSGAILGMKEREINDRFDEIVAFSGVEKFIDTPVKHYSSGMYLRLAFAVAAHLRTEILLIDEVLAVGDAAFQKKCIDKMSEVAHEGRTVLFVSHNLGTVSRLCNRGLLLDAGEVAMQGPISHVVGMYGRLVASQDEEAALTSTERVTLNRLKVESSAPSLDPSAPLTFSFRIEIKHSYWNLFIQLGITTPEGLNLVLDSVDSERLSDLLTPGRYDIVITMPALWLSPGIYSSRIKVIAHPEKGPTERFYSEWIEITVEGGERVGSSSYRVLAPISGWSIQPAH
ncbi:MAG: ABC transporter ATP-binding protein [Desulfobacteraceae bacterium]|jgi:lipopolysaccharide transport system ATP-binding protein